MVSDFRKKKLLHVFRFFDNDASGTLEKKDFERGAAIVSKMMGWQQGDAKSKEISDLLLKIWADLESVADKDKDGAVTEGECIAMWDAFAKNPSSAHSWQSLYCKYNFQLQDTSGDGAVDSEEFVSLCTSLGGNKDEAVTAFQKLSKGKSTVSWPEYQELWREFYSSEDPNEPGNFIFGTSTF